MARGEKEKLTIVHNDQEFTVYARRLAVPGISIFYNVRRPHALRSVLPRRFAVKFRPEMPEEEVRYRIERETEALKLLKGLSTVPQVFDEVKVSGEHGQGIAIELLLGEDFFELSEPHCPIRQHLDVEHVWAGIEKCFQDVSGRLVEHLDPEFQNVMIVRRMWQQYTLDFLSLFVERDQASAWLWTFKTYRNALRVVLIDWEQWRMNENQSVCIEANGSEAKAFCRQLRRRIAQ